MKGDKATNGTIEKLLHTFLSAKINKGFFNEYFTIEHYNF